MWENSKPSLVDGDFHHELRLIMSLQPNSIEPFAIMVNQSMLCHCSLSSCLGQPDHLSCLHTPKKNQKEQVLLLKLLWGSEHFSPGSHRKVHFTRKTAPLEPLKQSQTLTFRAETKRPQPCPWHLSATDTRASCNTLQQDQGTWGAWGASLTVIIQSWLRYCSQEDEWVNLRDLLPLHQIQIEGRNTIETSNLKTFHPEKNRTFLGLLAFFLRLKSPEIPYSHQQRTSTDPKPLLFHKMGMGQKWDTTHKIGHV